MVLDRVAEKYLTKYAEPVSAFADRMPDERYAAALVVPIYGEETQTFLRLIDGDGGSEKRLIILVVNAPSDAPPRRVEMNDAFLRLVRESGAVVSLGSGAEWVSSPNGRAGADVVLLDATQGLLTLRAKEGVGRARKMGLDFALALHLRGLLESPMCGSSDADVTLPAGYFRALHLEGKYLGGERTTAAGLLFPYQHCLPPEEPDRTLMTQLEVSFRYYVLGLHHARSPYAFHTLGSSLAVSLPHYARVRGVPNRQAGEDFHLLAKLSKLAPLIRMRSPTIEIETRLSDRVPFGTGPSFFKALQEPEQGVPFHHPSAFDWLRDVIESLTEAARRGPGTELQFPSTLPEWARVRARAVFASASPHLSACPTAAHRVRRLHEKFDALATIQFIHEAHRNGLLRVRIETAFELSPFLASGLGPKEQLRHCVEKEQAIEAPAGLAGAY